MNRAKFQRLRTVTAEKLTIGGKNQQGSSEFVVHGDSKLEKNVLIGGDTSLSGKMSLGGDLNTSGNINTRGNLTVGNNLSIKGTTYLGQASFATFVNNTILVRDRLSVGNCATITSCTSAVPTNYLEFNKIIRPPIFN